MGPKSEALSLGDAVRQFALLMRDNNLALVYKNEAPWHFLFYRLTKEIKGSSRPAFLDHLRFDADGHYPRCRELSEFLHGLHTACTVRVGNPSYDEITLQPKITKIWEDVRKNLSNPAEKFLEKGLAIAKEEFPQRQANA
jgi:hypothetical protein